MPERRAIRYAHLSEAVEDAERLRESGYERAGTWSLEQNLDHLNRTMTMAIEGTSFKMPFFIRPILKMVLLPKMKRGDVIRFKATAPPALAPEDSPSLDAALDEFRRLTAEIESDRPLVEMHPLFGKLQRDEWVLMQRWHTEHHLSFLIPIPGDAASANDDAEAAKG